jgi:hypothetical protein
MYLVARRLIMIVMELLKAGQLVLDKVMFALGGVVQSRRPRVWVIVAPYIATMKILFLVLLTICGIFIQ